MIKARTNYTRDFNLAILAQINSGISVAQVARENGLNLTTLDLTKTYSAIVTYIPEDPPNIGTNLVWIYLKFPNGSIQEIHHTLNVQQSKKRDSEHWNQVEPWEVDLKGCLVGYEFEVGYHVIDPGSDDEILTFSYGSQNANVTHFCNPPNPAEVNPRDIYGAVKLVYEGHRTLSLVAIDDNNIRIGSGHSLDTINIFF